jgi:hypothetical protein
MNCVLRCVQRALIVGLVVGLTAPAWAAPAGDEASGPRAVPSAEELIGRLKPGHPRLLIDEAGFDHLRNRVATDATLKEWDEHVRREADRLLTAPLPRHVLPDGLRLLSTSRSVLGRSYTLALAYRLHGDCRYADRLWQELETVAAFPDFNPRHFLDTAEMTHALAIAYDWLYDTWRSTARAAGGPPPSTTGTRSATAA